MGCARALHTVFALLLLGVFFGQTLVCHAERAGVLTCPQEHAEKDGGCVGTTARDEAPSTLCHHCVCQSPAVMTAFAPVVLLALRPAAGHAIWPDLAPDAPVFAIEHPPQLA